MKRLDAFPTAAKPAAPAPPPEEPTPLPQEAANGPPAGNPPAAAPAPPQAKPGGVLAGRVVPPVKPVPKLTDEQLAILAAAPESAVLVVEAGAGTGKTFTLAHLARSLPGRGQYTAFNTKLVEDSKKAFPGSCPCNTIHSLAFRAEGKKFSARLDRKGRVRTSEIAARLGINCITVVGPDGNDKVLQPGYLAAIVMKAVSRFCQSADRDITPYHFPRLAEIDKPGSRENETSVREELLQYARNAWGDLSTPQGTLPFTHDYYVKVWQLNHPVISADYILLDEAQDTSPVMLDVLEQQVRRGTRVILVGDSAQQIYDWRGAVNALAHFPDAPRRLLSQSFRFGEAVALVANAVLRQLQEPSPLTMRGLPSIPSSVGVVAEPACIICRTNAGAVGHFLRAIGEGRKPYLVGGAADVIAFMKAAVDLQQGRGTEHPDLSCFATWTEVVAFAATEEGEDLRLLVKLIKEFTAQAILDALNQMPDEADADLIVGTAHRSKGREWPTVKLAADFPVLDKSDDAALRLLYVACTRAKLVLDISECPPFCGSQGDDGQESRTINIDAARKFQYEAPEAPETLAPQTTLVVEEPRPASAATAMPTKAPAPVLLDGAVPTYNTFAKADSGEWLIRGPRGQSGRVEVKLKSGKLAWKEIRETVWENKVVALYSVR